MSFAVSFKYQLMCKVHFVKLHGICNKADGESLFFFDLRVSKTKLQYTGNSVSKC